jgi:hypothetical protein
MIDRYELIHDSTGIVQGDADDLPSLANISARFETRFPNRFMCSRLGDLYWRHTHVSRDTLI